MSIRVSHKQLIFEQAHLLALAPMAGITDKPMRQLAKQFGADWTVSEMITSDPSLQKTRKTLQRSDHQGESGTIVVQIAGSRPDELAYAAQLNVENGAQVIDINMGCPAKKVCNVLAGSALLQNEKLVEEILQTVVKAVDVPVTLKTRLGWDDEHKNILTIAKMAEQAGIAALAIHGRTRTQMYKGQAEYDLIAQVRQQIDLPLWVNGDIDSPQKAVEVLKQTGANGVMIGRAAQGQPWLFHDIRYFIENQTLPKSLDFQAACAIVLNHIQTIHQHYGEIAGTRIARKHITWYLQALPNEAGQTTAFRQTINRIESASEQCEQLAYFLHNLELEVWPRTYAA